MYRVPLGSALFSFGRRHFFFFFYSLNDPITGLSTFVFIIIFFFFPITFFFSLNTTLCYYIILMLIRVRFWRTSRNSRLIFAIIFQWRFCRLSDAQQRPRPVQFKRRPSNSSLVGRDEFWALILRIPPLVYVHVRYVYTVVRRYQSTLENSWQNRLETRSLWTLWTSTQHSVLLLINY